MSWRALLLLAAPLVGAVFSLIDTFKRDSYWHRGVLAEMAVGAATLALVAAIVVVGISVLQGRRKEAEPYSDALAQLGPWWPVPLAALAAAAFMGMLGLGDRKVPDSELFQGMAAAAAVCAVAAFLYLRRQQSRAGDAVKVLSDRDGLPLVEWGDEMMKGTLLYDYTGKAKRRCWIEAAKDGTPVFVHESAVDDTAKWRPATVMLGVDAMVVGEKLMKRYGFGVRENTQAAPWAALQAFRLTTDAEYYGLATRGGDPLKPNQINHMVVAEFGVEWGDMIIAESKAGPAPMRELHRRLTLAFVNGRPAHLERLRATQMAGGSAETGGATAPARPETL